ncbi:hypothetical protein PMJEKBHI_01104 [Lacticaseibacillus rhamnosus]|nr:conserved hypothetical protein [Lacticaseibacillus rhamnosus ATCC 8530]KRK30612.1 hypothetical protein Q777_GL000399 [Lacticaseibacillus rhamnosus DSM 20021 = JCM 1136 = NBRC 3425]CAR88971.1 Putative protein without homology [Lacticaseibacillus rhamnosus Lc 705]SSA28178.1 hypothetical protein PMJEKBHI_01104 [Lacticaseibacillus rhamnosus]VTU54152.1 Putative protein without homology [Lactobacillus rhamnosus Lc 705] [Lacticaseibacillus rhamnosus]
MALGVMAGLWPLRPRSLHAGPCAKERVIESERKCFATFKKAFLIDFRTQTRYIQVVI